MENLHYFMAKKLKLFTLKGLIKQGKNIAGIYFRAKNRLEIY